MKYKYKLNSNAGAAVIIIQMAGSNFLELYSNNFFILHTIRVSVKLLHSGADLGFTERASLSIESLKQGVWGAQPLRSYRVFNFVQY